MLYGTSQYGRKITYFISAVNTGVCSFKVCRTSLIVDGVRAAGGLRKTSWQMLIGA